MAERLGFPGFLSSPPPGEHGKVNAIGYERDLAPDVVARLVKLCNVSSQEVNCI